jgi:hypothetical protein
MNRNAANLAQKLDDLSPELIAEVEDFVEFVRLRSEQRALARAVAAASAPSFEAIWNNPEDSVYDAL